jgi:hypothetical protein
MKGMGLDGALGSKCLKKFLSTKTAQKIECPGKPIGNTRGAK